MADPPKGFVPYTGDVTALAMEPPAAKKFVPFEGDVTEKPPEKEPTLTQTVIGAGANLPKSFVKNVLQPGMDIVNPIGAVLSRNKPGGLVDQAKGVGNLVRSAAAFAPDDEGTARGKLLAPDGGKEIDEARNKEQERGKKVLGGMWDHFKNEFGSFAGFKKAFMADPLAVGFDASMFLSAANAGRGLATRAARTAGVSLPAELAKPAAQAGEAINKVGRGVRTAVGIPGEATAHSFGLASGSGYDSVKQSVKAGFDREVEFIDSLNKTLPPEQTVKMAIESIRNMRKTRNKNYDDAMAILKAQNEYVERVKPDEILQGWQDAHQKYTHLEGTDFPITKLTPGLDRELMDLLEKWYQGGRIQPDVFYSPVGLDALKKSVRSIKESLPFDKRQDRAYIGHLESYIKGKISEQLPIYDKMMKDYHLATEGLEEMETALSLNDKATYDTGLGKLQRAMRDDANSKLGNRMRMLDELEKHGAKGLKSRLAGQMMSSWTPRGLAGRNPYYTALASLLSGHPEGMALILGQMPQLVGRGGYALGGLKRSFADMAKEIGPVIPKGAAIQSVENAAESQNNAP